MNILPDFRDMWTLGTALIALGALLQQHRSTQKDVDKVQNKLENEVTPTLNEIREHVVKTSAVCELRGAIHAQTQDRLTYLERHMRE